MRRSLLCLWYGVSLAVVPVFLGCRSGERDEAPPTPGQLLSQIGKAASADPRQRPQVSQGRIAPSANTSSAPPPARVVSPIVPTAATSPAPKSPLLADSDGEAFLREWYRQEAADVEDSQEPEAGSEPVTVEPLAPPPPTPLQSRWIDGHFQWSDLRDGAGKSPSR